MSTFDNSKITSYNGGVETDQMRIGYVSSKNLVVALPFTTGNVGASKFSFSLTLCRNINNPNTTASGEKMAFAITEAGDEQYKDYNGPGDGSIIYTSNSYGTDYYDISGSVEKMLLPNKDYVLWLFPNYKDMQISTSLSYNSSTVRTYELSGAAGLVHIDIGTEVIAAIPYIDNGVGWDQTIPRIDNGTGWDVCG